MGHSHGHSHGRFDDDISHSVFVNSWLDKIFAYDPLSNSLLAVSMITAITQSFIALSPKLGGRYLHFLVAFAEGSMLGTIFLNVLPEINWNITSSLMIIIGFLSFVTLDKVIQIISMGGDSSHSHSHSHDHMNNKKVKQTPSEPSLSVANSLSPWLNIFADSLHNVTDGISLAIAFHSSTAHGISAFMVMVCHEIPHQFGDFALLINSGTSKVIARKAQLVATLGTLAGCLLGNWLGNVAMVFDEVVTPITAGVFLYVAMIGVLPDILEVDVKSSARSQIVTSVVQLFGIACGVLTLIFLDI